MATKPLTKYGVKSAEDLLRRALRAWHSDSAQRPGSASAVEAHGGRWYVVLRAQRRGPAPLAVYRLKNDGLLRRMRRWPKSITG